MADQDEVVEPIVPPVVEGEGAPAPVENEDGVEAEGIEDAEEVEGTEPKPPTPPALPNWASRRIDEMTKTMRTEQRARMAAEARVTELTDFIRTGGETEEAEQPAPQVDASGNPLPAPKPRPQVRPPTQAEFDRAVAMRAQGMVQEQGFADACNQEFERGTKELGTAFKSNLENFQQVGGMPREVFEAALDTGAGYKVLNYLGGNLDEAMRVKALPPVKQAIELDRIARKLTAKAGTVSQAPEPPRPLERRPVSAGRKTLATTKSMDEFVALREKGVSE